MDQVSALNAEQGQAIFTIIMPTFKIFGPHLVANAEAIKSIPRRESSFGPHPKQKLDVYRAPDETATSPILIFLYGGGLIRGDKVSPNSPGGLVYHNLGTFFAKRGITTIIPDYRKVNSPSGGHDAVYPSGGEDVSLVLKWLESSELKGKRDVYLIGNSAGGVHAATFLLEPKFLEQRKKLVSGEGGLTLKGFIALATPFHFKSGLPGRAEVNQAYYGSHTDDKCPYGLLEAVAKAGKSRKETAVPDTLVMLGEFDPADEIGEPVEEFVALWKKTWGDDGLTFEKVADHNHISPPLALMTGEAKAEKWGEDVAKWIKSSST